MFGGEVYIDNVDWVTIEVGLKLVLVLSILRMLSHRWLRSRGM